jgi:Polyketide cyclase / dehydrase and lipid transport
VATVIREIAVDAPAPRSWAALRDFGALHERLVTGFVTDAVMVGPGERQVTFFTGAVARERLVGIDEQTVRLAYSVVEGPMGSTHHNASAQIVPAGPEQCRIVWITDVLPDELADRTAGLMEAGLQAMKSTLEGAATPA